MKIISNMVLCATCVAVLCVGCQSTPTESAVSIDDAVVGLVPQLVQEALASPCFAGGKRPVMALGRLKNDTMSIRGGTLDLMTSQIGELFSKSGRVVMSSAFGDVSKEGISAPTDMKLLAPTLVLHGKLTQRNSSRQDGRIQREFFLMLSIHDLATGNQVWHGRRNVVFLVDDKQADW